MHATSENLRALVQRIDHLERRLAELERRPQRWVLATVPGKRAATPPVPQARAAAREAS